MTPTERSARVGGAWLAVASLLMIAALAFHGPIDPDLNVQMARIADAGVRWSVVHWIAAAALSLYAVGGLIVLNSGSRLTDGFWTTGAWAVITVGALCTTSTAVIETTVVANTALAGSNEVFRAWWAFAEAMANGFAFLALAVAVVAGNESRYAAAGAPAWAARIAVAAGIASFTGWALGMWVGLRAGTLLWVAASIVMCLWMLYFGITLARSHVAAADVHPSRAAELRERSVVT